MAGMMLHQDGSTHCWLPGRTEEFDLIVTLDDATGDIYSGFLVEEEGTMSSFQGLGEVFAAHGLPCSLYTDRASHYFHTPQAGGKVDKTKLSQVGRALAQLGIYNARFAVTPEQPGSAFVAVAPEQWQDVLCVQEERTVGNDNTVRFNGLVLQIPPSPLRPHYVKAKVRVHHYPDATLAVFHGPRRLARYPGRRNPDRRRLTEEGRVMPLDAPRPWTCGQRSALTTTPPAQQPQLSGQLMCYINRST